MRGLSRRSSPRPLDAINLLELAPVRRAPWRESGDRVVLERPRPQRGLRHLGPWIGYFLAARRMRLDELGSFAWRRFDGRHAVGRIAEEMRRSFGERAEPAEERLGQFVRVLRREELLAYPGFDGPDVEAIPCSDPASAGSPPASPDGAGDRLPR